ncbi:multicopy suppressor of BFA (Brefeldin A) [Sorochytrium milnesiophthora]
MASTTQRAQSARQTSPAPKQKQSQRPQSSTGGEGKAAHVPKPDLEKHKARIADMHSQIDAMRARLNQVRDEISSTAPNKQNGAGGNDQRSQLKNKLSDVRKQKDDLRKNKDDLFTRLKQLNESIKRKTDDLKVMKEKLGYKTAEDADNQIKRLDAMIESGTLKLIDEKKAIAEISQLRKSKTLFANLEARQADIDADRQAIADIKAKLDALQPSSNDLQSSFEDLRRELDSVDSNQQANYQRVQGLYDKRTQLQNELNALYDQKRAMEEEFRAARDRQAQAAAEEKARKAQEYKARREQYEREKLEAEAQKERDAAEIPAFTEELTICKNLIDFIAQKTNASALVAGSDTTTTGPTTIRGKLMGNKADFAGDKHNIRQVEAAMPAGSKLMKRGDDEYADSDSLFAPKRPTKHNKKQAASSAAAAAAGTTTTTSSSSSSAALKLPLSIMEDFWRIKVTAPATTSDVTATVEALREKITYYREHQDRVTRENKERAEAKIRAIMTRTAGGADGTPAAAEDDTAVNAADTNGDDADKKKKKKKKQDKKHKQASQDTTETPAAVNGDGAEHAEPDATTVTADE